MNHLTVFHILHDRTRKRLMEIQPNSSIAAFKGYVGQQFVVEDSRRLPIAAYKLFDRKSEIKTGQRKDVSTSVNLTSGEASSEPSNVKKFSIFVIIKDQLEKISLDRNRKSVNGKLSSLSEVDRNAPFSEK